MASQFSLREFQTRLSQQIRDAASRPGTTSRLGFLCGGRHWLVALSAIEEVIPVPVITPVPGVKNWFRGMINVRGNLYAVTDLNTFLDGSPTPDTPHCRLLLAHLGKGMNAAFRVERVIGLRQSHHWPVAATARTHPCIHQSLTDDAGQDWQELDFARLLAQPELLAVEA
jgi:twitching motility protein PilI